MDNEQQNIEETNKLIEQRREKLKLLRENGKAFPNKFRRNALAGEILAKYSDVTDEQLEAEPVRVKVAGRMMTRRIMGKNSFAHIQDMSGQIQLFVARDTFPRRFLQRTVQEMGYRRYCGCRRHRVSYPER